MRLSLLKTKSIVCPGCFRPDFILKYFRDFINDTGVCVGVSSEIKVTTIFVIVVLVPKGTSVLGQLNNKVWSNSM